MKVSKVEIPKQFRTRCGPKANWWIEGVEEYETTNDAGEQVRCTRCGPYSTRDEAIGDMHGMQRVINNMNYTGRRRTL